MKNFLSLVLLLFFASIIGCEKSENNLPIEGSWIEVSTKSDTIDFTYFMSGPAFELRRGFELSSGYWLPKYGAGLYRYELKDDSIALNYTFSSIGGFIDYYFHWISNNSFEIGNFYDQSLGPDELIIFSKIE